MVSTSAANDTIDAAIVEKMATAASGPPVSDSGISSKSKALSIQIDPSDSITPRSTQRTGMSQRLDLRSVRESAGSHRHAYSIRQAGLAGLR